MQERFGIDDLIEISYREHIILEIERIAPYFHNSHRVQLRIAQHCHEQQRKSRECPPYAHRITLFTL